MSSIIARMAAVGVVWAGTVGAACVWPATATAQIASVVRPPGARGARPAAPPDTSTAPASHPTTQLTGLTAWVDSAVLANARVGDAPSADTSTTPHAAPATKHAGPVTSTSTSTSTVRFQNGARAPDTASLVPAIAIGGLLIFGVGLVLGRAVRIVGLLVVGGAFVSYGAGLWVQHAARQAWVAAQDGTRAERRAESDAMLATARSSMVSNVSNKIAIGAPVARLVIPTIGEDDIVLEGVNAYELNGGPGHLPGSALPGDAGNAIISAHRDRHFRDLDRVQVGDTVLTYVNGEESIWRVVGRRVVSAATPALFTTEAATLTLTTCWPVRALGPAPDRLIVSATRIGTRRSAA